MAHHEADSVAAPGRFRDRHRQQRRQEFLEAARAVIADEGLDALTMQRVTDDLQCAVGSIYRYFPSKGALIAAVQDEALDVLGQSLASSQTRLDALLTERRAEPRLAALARAVTAARFWIAAETAFPREVELVVRLFTHPGQVLTDEEAGPKVLPASMGFLHLGRSLLDDAVATDALRAGPSLERSIILLAGTTGVLLTSGLRRWDDVLFDGPRLAEDLLWDLFTAWGARPDDLTEVDELVGQLADRGQLVPAV